jgi:hypothetical protein
MRLLPHLAAVCGFVCALQSAAEATITINIFAGDLRGADGTTLLAQGTLLQLINLGADGVFNQIRLDDGNISSTGQWVSGDDTLLNVPYLIGNNPGDFSSAAAFDLAAGTDPTTGIVDRGFRFQIADVTPGTKIGIRWFPGLQASNFASITLAAGQRYGEFTRQANPKYGGVVWVIGNDGATDNFDALATTAITGQDNVSAAGSPNAVLVPEPAAIGMSLIGAAGLALLRRRRA